jgi:hypothetical protein
MLKPDLIDLREGWLGQDMRGQHDEEKNSQRPEIQAAKPNALFVWTFAVEVNWAH